MAIGVLRNYSASGCALNKALLNKIGLQHVLDGAALFTQCSGNAVGPYWTTIKFFNDGHQQAPVEMIKTIFVDTQHVQRCTGDLLVYESLSLHLTKIPHPAKQAISDSGSST